MPKATIVPETPHARLSASNADRWLHCPGCVNESGGIPDVPSEFGAEGTVAHLIASDVMRTRDSGHDAHTGTYIGMKFSVDGVEVVVDQDLLDSVTEYIGVVDLDNLLGAPRYVEVDLTPALKELDQDFGGVADCVQYDVARKTLRVYDYKHGVGILVDADDNRQAKYYALGAVLGGGFDAHQVEVVIVQPRAHSGDTVKRWKFPVSELLEYEAELMEGATATRADSPLTVAGPWCQFCPALVRPCPAVGDAERQMLALAKTDGIFVLPSEKLGAALDLCSALEKRIKALRELAFSTMEKGKPVEGWKLVEKRGIRKWRNEDDVRETFGKAAFQTNIRSVALMEKLTGKKEFASIIKDTDLVTKNSGGLTMVPASDKRPPAITYSPDDFTEVTE